MQKILTLKEIHNLLIAFIEYYKTNMNIDYKTSIDTIKQLLNEIEEEYKSLEE